MECAHCGARFFGGQMLVPLTLFYTGEWASGFREGDEHVHLECFLGYLKDNTLEEED